MSETKICQDEIHSDRLVTGEQITLIFFLKTAFYFLVIFFYYSIKVLLSFAESPVVFCTPERPGLELDSAHL